jgi:hypothetical protein
VTTACTYCGCDVHAHEPVFVEEVRSGERAPAGQFCNYACLVQHVDAEGLEDGAFCRVDLQ